MVKDKVICINDAPIVAQSEDLVRFRQMTGLYNFDRVYKVGDIFEVVSDWCDDELLIWYPPINSTMSVSKKNFVRLDEWRDKKISDILMNQLPESLSPNSPE